MICDIVLPFLILISLQGFPTVVKPENYCKNPQHGILYRITPPRQSQMSNLCVGDCPIWSRGKAQEVTINCKFIPEEEVVSFKPSRIEFDIMPVKKENQND